VSEGDSESELLWNLSDNALIDLSGAIVLRLDPWLGDGLGEFCRLDSALGEFCWLDSGLGEFCRLESALCIDSICLVKLLTVSSIRVCFCLGAMTDVGGGALWILLVKSIIMRLDGLFYMNKR